MRNTNGAEQSKDTTHLSNDRENLKEETNVWSQPLFQKIIDSLKPGDIVLNEQALHNELKQVIDYRKAIQRIEKRIKKLRGIANVQDGELTKLAYRIHNEALDKTLEIVKEELKK